MKSLPVFLLLAAIPLLPLNARAEEPERAQATYYQSAATPDHPTFQVGADGTLYQVSYDLTQGREYWRSPYPNHPNYGIRYVYVVDAQGQRLKPDLYVELADGRLELATVARNRVQIYANQ